MNDLLRMVRLVANYPARFAWFLLISTVFSGASGSLPLVAKNAIGILTQQAPPEWMVQAQHQLADALPSLIQAETNLTAHDAYLILLGFGLAALLLKCSMQYLQRYLEGWLTQKVVLDTQSRVADHLLTLDLSYFDGERSGDLLSRMTNDLNMLRSSVKLSCTLLTAPLTLLVLLATIFWMSWELAVLGLIAAPLGGFLLNRLSRKMRKAAKASQEKRADLTTVMVQFLAGIRTVKAFACEEFESRQFERENRKLFSMRMKYTRARALVRPVMETISTIGALCVLYIGGSWVLQGNLGVDQLGGFVLALLAMYNPAKELSTTNAELQEATPGAERVFQILDLQPTIRPGVRQLEQFQQAIRYENVDFGYVPNAPVLKGVDLTIPCGACYAFVGPSGAGKSTLADLLPRFYDPKAGRITIDGSDLRDFDLRSLRNRIAVVCQDPFLFNASIRDNIAYGRSDVTDEQIAAAARAANVHEEILALPQGYETLAGERGGSLSGGQRQRVAIARAILKDAPILILDEATSSLDSESERLVQNALQVLMKGRTSLVIAHRLSTVRDADCIVYLEDGRIVSQGNHDDLLQSCPGYERLVRLQGLNAVPA